MKIAKNILLAIAILSALGYVVTVARNSIGGSAATTIIKQGQPHPNSTPLEKAAKKCTEYLRDYPMEILRADARTNDSQWGVAPAPITVFVTVRMDGPAGPKKAIAIFHCALNGDILQIAAWPDYFSVSQP